MIEDNNLNIEMMVKLGKSLDLIPELLKRVSVLESRISHIDSVLKKIAINSIDLSVKD